MQGRYHMRLCLIVGRLLLNNELNSLTSSFSIASKGLYIRSVCHSTLNILCTRFAAKLRERDLLLLLPLFVTSRWVNG